MRWAKQALIVFHLSSPGGHNSCCRIGSCCRIMEAPNPQHKLCYLAINCLGHGSLHATFCNACPVQFFVVQQNLAMQNGGHSVASPAQLGRLASDSRTVWSCSVHPSSASSWTSFIPPIFSADEVEKHFRRAFSSATDKRCVRPHRLPAPPLRANAYPFRTATVSISS
jgi:hypothetical protein